MSTNLLVELMVRDVEAKLRASRWLAEPLPARRAPKLPRAAARPAPTLCPEEPRALRPSL